MTRGIDYAWADPKPAPSCLLQSGVKFVMRYFSHDPAKDLAQAELDALLAAGISVGIVWETTAGRMLAGYGAGQADASEADLRATRLGMAGIPLYFACDFDAAPADQAAISAYLDGVAGVIGRPRTGMYSGYWPMSRAFDAGDITWGWQTYAWSGGNWDQRAQLRQVQNNVTVCGVSADWDESQTADFGQFPRPGTAPQPPPPGVTWTEEIMQQLPTLAQGATGTHVRTVQFQLGEKGRPVTIDGIYGPNTASAVAAVQSSRHLTADGITGPQTWPVLLGVL